MSLNTAKSRVLRIAASARLKTSACNNRSLTFRGKAIPGTGLSDAFKFLGVSFTWNGLLKIRHLPKLNEALQEITTAPLKPYQRLRILKAFAFPRFIHQLVLGTTHINTLKALDNATRWAVRTWLRLPSDTNTGFLYAPVREGGLGIPSYRTTIILAKRRRVENLLNSPRPTIQGVGAWIATAPTSTIARRNLRVREDTVWT